ncbi:MAG: FAD-dependent oxidoreductase [Deltaproteobacteria bacterium]|nr:FAD-dependent oxidoreductase [Deltaproteobacteria bacterium]
MKIRIFSDLEKAKGKGMKSLFPERTKIAVGLGSCGIAAGAERVYQALKGEVEKQGADISVAKTGCLGFCGEEPLVNVTRPGAPLVVLHGITEDDAREIIERAAGGNILEDKVFCKVERVDNFLEPKGIRFGTGYANFPHYDEIPFYTKQHKVVLRESGLIDPENIDEYIAVGGYSALMKALVDSSPERVLTIVKTAGLRGRGGGGFPTGVKWEIARNTPADKKYIICNADEGDPGAYMNRNEMESDPHMLIEGMIIGAYAIGACEGIIYVRTEYPLAIKRLENALEQARAYGFLGDNICNTQFNFDIYIVCGAGAFVCGEETALIASIEGFPGRPRPRPPFPAVSGLYGKPTVINNVETWCNLPVIISKGPEWFADIGTEECKGTKVFSLVGKVKNVGLVEVPMGISLKEIIYEIGGGGLKGKEIKAVQTGGPSGGCIPATLFDSRVDYDTLKQVGSIMGSGGMVVMDEDTCMVDITKYFLSFTQEESCGKCIPCRRGLEHMLGILEDISAGRGEMRHLEELEELAKVINVAALCGLGQTAPNPVLTTLRYFKDEYEEHIIQKRCRAGVCDALFLAPCENRCPLNMNVPGFVQLLKEERFADAYHLILEDNPLPAVCGRVCHHPCEGKCRRGEVDGPVGIRDIRRFITDCVYQADDTRELRSPVVFPETGKKLAIIGAGPAGLTAAYYLRRLGHEVTVFEAYPKAGGMLQYGIPEFRLPKDILQKEINVIKDLGVHFEFNKRVGDDITLEDMRADGFAAVFVATGTHQDIPLGVPGEDLDGVYAGMKFLRDVNMGKAFQVGKEVVVIGGGNVAIDCARVATRLGAMVTILYRRERKDMPALEEEIHEAELEGVSFIFLGAPRAIVGAKGKVAGIEVTRMKLGEFDSSGRRRPVPTEEIYTIQCNAVITAIGGKADTSVLEQMGVTLSRNGTVQVDKYTLQTSVPLCYAGGDVVTGPWTVSDAMGYGKNFAKIIDAQLMGVDRFDGLKRDVTYSMDVSIEPQGGKRNVAQCSSLTDYTGNFKEVVQSLSREQALREATRCLRCDVKPEEEEEI